MKLAEFNALDKEAAFAALQKCCGATSWVNAMNASRPFENEADLYKAALNWWTLCNEQDVLEAFEHHPKIGSVADLEKKFASTATWAAGEQAAVKSAGQATLQALAKGNDDYEAKFGYIFIVCATGKSAEEMLSLLEARLPNSKEEEFEIAKAEQMKITNIRLEKLLKS